MLGVWMIWLGFSIHFIPYNAIQLTFYLQDKNSADGNVLVRQEVTDLSVLHEVEGLALVMMCSARVVTRKLAVHLLKEVRNIFNSANTQVMESVTSDKELNNHFSYSLCL